MTPPSGFEWVHDGHRVLLVRADVRDWLVALLRAADERWAGYETRALSGGRGGVTVVRAAGHDVVVRRYHRGGLPAWVLRDTYFGRSPRPFRELCVTEELRRRGAPVIEVYGASVHWLLPACYKGALATRYMEQARTLWEWLRDADGVAVRAAAFAAVGRAIRRLHDAGGRHPDLNLNNILIGAVADGLVPVVRFIDFDRARAAPPAHHTPEVDLARLERSARKLDPTARVVTAADLDVLHAAYREGGACA